MSDTAIKIEGVTKKYQLGAARHDTLRDRIMHAVRQPFRRLRGVTEADPTDFWALRDVSFNVKRGEVVGIIGRNGAGKSTLLKILSRITEPTTGRVTIRGQVASLLEVGTGFHPELTGRENIFLNGAILGMSRSEIRRKFDEIVAFAEVDKFLDTPVKHYSSGMYVRLAFAVAAHLEPDILIVDEVLAVGDAQFQQKCLGKMQSIAASHGRTILFVSHNLRAVEHICSRGLLLDRGQLVRDASAHEVVGEYLAGDSVRIAGKGVKSLNDELDLHSLSVTPDTVQTRAPVAFQLELAAKLDCQVHDLHLFVYNGFGERATILDLRDAAQPGGTRRLASGTRLKFAGTIPRLTLVEGNYRIGLCIRTSRDFLVNYDLVDLRVSAPPSGGNLMPYAPEYQGSAVLDYDFQVERA